MNSRKLLHGPEEWMTRMKALTRFSAWRACLSWMVCVRSKAGPNMAVLMTGSWHKDSDWVNRRVLLGKLKLKLSIPQGSFKAGFCYQESHYLPSPLTVNYLDYLGKGIWFPVSQSTLLFSKTPSWRLSYKACSPPSPAASLYSQRQPGSLFPLKAFFLPTEWSSWWFHWVFSHKHCLLLDPSGVLLTTALL